MKLALAALLLCSACGAWTPDEPARLCRGADLKLDHSVGGDGRRFQFVLVNVSRTKCRLSGYPTSLTGTSDEGGTVSVTLGRRNPSLDPEPVEIRHGQFGSFFIEYRFCDGVEPSHAPLYRSSQVGVPGGGVVSLDGNLLPVGCETLVSRLGMDKKYE